MRRILRISAAILLGLSALAAPCVGEIAEPHFVLYGRVTVDGLPATPGTPIALEVEGETLAAYALGSEPELGDLYVLRVPLDTVGERLPGHARTGDAARVVVDGTLAAVLAVGPAGRTQALDLDPGELTSGIFIGDVEIFEGDAGPSIATLSVSLSQPAALDVEVDFTTRDGSASSASDYVPRLGRVIVPTGETSATLDLEIHGDPDIESDEEFFVDLSNPLNGVLLDPEGRVTIVDDDTPPALSVGDLSLAEPNPGASTESAFVVRLSHTWDQAVSVDYAAVDLPGSAVNGTDYALPPGSLVIPAGALSGQVAVTVFGDVLQEDEERFELQLSNPANASLADGVAVATISEHVRILRWLEEHVDSVEGAGTVPGLAGAFDVALSPDGSTLYAAGRAGDSLVAFRREADGTLTHLATYENGVDGVSGLNGIEAVLVSADGSMVFAAAFDDGAVSSFLRQADGSLAVADVEFDAVLDPESGRVVEGLQGASGLAAAGGAGEPLHLYVTGTLDDAVAIFSVRADGLLEYETAAEDGVFGADGLAQASSITISADGSDVYVTGFADDSVAHFSRSATDGFLTFREIHVDGSAGVFGLDGALDVRLDPAESFVYVAGQLSNAVAVFERDPATGFLTYVDSVVDGVDGVDGLQRVTGLGLSNDPQFGDYLFATSYGDDAVAVFARAVDGTLVYRETARDGVGGVDGLAGANALVVSAEDQNVYVAGSGESALAVFERDIVAPDPLLTLTSTSHAVNQPSNLTLLDFEWSNANDQGYGVAEYWLLIDRMPDTVAPAGPPSLRVPHGADPHSASLAVPEDAGDYFLHVTTCDLIGNCSPTHLGPFAIDTLAPGAPASLESPSHAVPSESPLIEVTWSVPVDPPAPSGYASGVAGYGVDFSPSDSVDCDGTIDLDASVSAVTSELLPVGTFYFHLCIVDEAGNTTAEVLGPLEILPDVTPPQVAVVDSVAGSIDGVVSPGERLDGATTQLLVGFSEAVQAVGADDPASYLLVGAGADGAVQTTACGGLGGDDTAVALSAASYDDAARTAAVRFVSLGRGDYRLLVCSTIRDLRDNPLGGGVDHALDFSSPGSFLPNPNFDLDLAGWTLSDPAASWSSADADGRPTSGSVRSRITSQAESLSQCVDMATIPGPFSGLDLRARARIVEHASTIVRVDASITFYDQVACAGAALGGVTSAEIAGDTAGAWLDLVAAASIPAAARSVRASVLATPDDLTADADVEIDRCALLRQGLFADDFETGDLSAWSNATP